MHGGDVERHWVRMHHLQDAAQAHVDERERHQHAAELPVAG